MELLDTRNVALKLFLILHIGVLWHHPAWAENAKRKTVPAAIPKVAPLPANANGITTFAYKEGVTGCAERINQVTNYMTAGQPSRAFMFIPPSEPNQREMSVSMEIAAPNEPLTYASAAFAPENGGCSSVSEAVVFWETSCEQVEAKAFAGAIPAGALMNKIRILEIGALARVFLMPVKSGCISIKKELLPAVTVNAAPKQIVKK